MSLILDASITLAWVNIEESTPAIRDVFDELGAMSAWVPSLWWLEVANVLRMNLKRKRYTETQRDTYLESLKYLYVETDNVPVSRTWQAASRLADCHNLTVYDAAYLELALRRGLPLATLDRELRAAALAEGVALLGI